MSEGVVISQVEIEKSIEGCPAHFLAGQRHLDALKNLTFIALGLHLCGAVALHRGLSHLSSVRVVRSSYFHIGAFALQGFASMRLRWSREALEKGVKEFKEGVKEAHKKHKGALPPVATKAFENYGVWAAYGLKYGEAKNQEKRLRELTEPLENKEGFPFLNLAPLALTLSVFFSKKALPLGLLGLFAAASLEGFRSAKKDWEKVYHKEIKEALSRVVTLTGKGQEIASHLEEVRLVEDNKGILEKLDLGQVRKLEVPTFPSGTHFPKLAVLKVTQGNMEEIAKLSITKLKIEVLPNFNLPPTLRVLETISLPWEGGNPLGRFEHLTEVTVKHFAVGSARLLSGLKVLKRLKVRDAKTMVSTDLDWLKHHQQIEVVKIKGASISLWPMVQSLPPSFLVFVKGEKGALKRDEVKKAFQGKNLDLTFKI